MKLTPPPCGTALAVLFLIAQPALAIPFSGTFVHDDDDQFFTFTLNAIRTVDLATTSYTGGGFVPYLHVWDSSGSDWGGFEAIGSDASYTLSSLDAGTYYVGLTVANNKATGDFPGGSATPTASVFDHNGLGDFTGSVADGYGCGSGPFWSSACDQRSGAWVLNIIGVDSASLWPADTPADTPTNPAPEPATLSLALAGAAAFFARRRRATPA
jgi:MYXO-CTERM domain-containing protein